MDLMSDFRVYIIDEKIYDYRSILIIASINSICQQAYRCHTCKNSLDFNANY